MLICTGIVGHWPRHSLRPVSSTTQIAVIFCETSNPTKRVIDKSPMVQITRQRRPVGGTICRSGADRDYRMSTYDNAQDDSSRAEASRFSARKRSLSCSGRASKHRIIAPFGKPCIEGCIGHTDRQPIHVAPVPLEEPRQLADIVAHSGLHGSYCVFLLGFQIF